ncbi:MAG TPA: hypothetical protein VMY42_15010 [Thermoguttaceae bacterium]|nr:hypothetical protein [Thermoguttaceae bacterium]
MSRSRVLLAVFLLGASAWEGAGAADRAPTDPNPATPEQVLGHHLIRSARLGPAETEDGGVNLMPWREQDDVVEGWDWSLPNGIEPVPRSGLVFSPREQRRFPGNKLADVAVFWRDVEPEEGHFDFEPLHRKLENLPEDITGYRFHFYATVAYRLSNDRKERIAPQWLAKYDIPVIDMTSVEGRFQLFNYPIWDERYHKRYLRVIEAMGRSGIPQLEGLRIVYVGAISKSWGEELYIPREVGAWCEQHVGLTPDVLEKCLNERLDAWAAAFSGVEYKLAWVGAGSDGGGGELDYRGMGDRVIQHAYDLGMGQRCGFVENYLYQLNSPWLGQHVDDEGHLVVDETCAPIAENRAFGDENEEYGRYWTGRFGPLETHPYRYHQSMIRALQMRRNYLCMSSASVDMDPPLTAYVSLALGRNVHDSPDAFCYLRQSTVRASSAGKQGKTTPIRNFERWLSQRDRDGYRTTPAIRAAQHEMMWMVPPELKYDWIARRTDMASENRRIGLALDDRFLSGGPYRVAIKVTYHDVGHGRWALVYALPEESHARRSIQCGDTGKVFTATFHLSDACFPAGEDDFDFYIEAEGEDATVSFVRVIKTPRPSSTELSPPIK